jgi:ATP-binding cassette, subfamily C, bacterial CydD
VRALDPRLVQRARPVRLLLGLDVALGLAAAVLTLVQATLLARIVARAFDGASLGAVESALVLLALVFALRGLLAWAFEVAGARAASTVLSELRLELVARRLRAQPAALDGVTGGEISAAGIQGVDALAAYFGRYLPQVVLACIVPLAVIGWVAAIDLTSALIMLVTLPLVPVFMWLIGRYTEERTREQWTALRLLSTHFLDVVRGLPTLRLLNRSRAQLEALREVGERYRRATMGSLRITFLSGSVLELGATLGVALVAVTIGVRLVGGNIGLEAGLTVLVLAPELYLPLRRLGAQYHASAEGIEVADRILALLEAPDEVGARGALAAPSPRVAVVRFENVAFAYPSRPALVLDGLDLELLPGETLALVGDSGTGKSTVANLLLRLAAPTSGRVTVGGVDLAHCDADTWRRQLAWVPQQPTLFRGTVADNIALGRRAATEQEIYTAARDAGADGFVRGLPAGYDTVVGDGGRPLSAGERRRIALARAFLRDAPLVVLDEPTADLDPESAALVGRAVERLRAGRTLLLIAHRPELANLADRIVLLEHGRATVSFERAAA